MELEREEVEDFIKKADKLVLDTVLFAAQETPFPFPLELEVKVTITKAGPAGRVEEKETWDKVNLQYEIPKFILEPHNTEVPPTITYAIPEGEMIGNMSMKSPTFFRYFYGTDFVGKMYIDEHGHLCIVNMNAETLTGSDFIDGCTLYSNTV